MATRIVVSHLTRMGPGFICVAGMDPDTGRHYRPLTNRKLKLSHLTIYGGHINIGEIVDLGKCRPIGTPPEVEDTHFHEHQLTSVGRIDPGEFWQLLESAAHRRLTQIFGPELRRIGATCATSRGEGSASLGCLIPSKVVDLLVERRHSGLETKESVRIVLDIGEYEFRLPVTDLRFYSLDEADERWIVHHDIIDSVRDAVRSEVPIILGVGLSRAYRHNSADQGRHWLQVNNIHLRDDPLWGPDSLLRSERSGS
jgi:hypothetical protein